MRCCTTAIDAGTPTCITRLDLTAKFIEQSRERNFALSACVAIAAMLLLTHNGPVSHEQLGQKGSRGDCRHP
jgi:hypothetical protein